MNNNLTLIVGITLVVIAFTLLITHIGWRFYKTKTNKNRKTVKTKLIKEEQVHDYQFEDVVLKVKEHEFNSSDEGVYFISQEMPRLYKLINSKSNSINSWEVIDQGKLLLTNKTLIIMGHDKKIKKEYSSFLTFKPLTSEKEILINASDETLLIEFHSPRECKETLNYLNKLLNK